MKFVLAPSMTYWWPVVVRIPDPEKAGSIIEQKLKVQFEPEEQDAALEQAEIYAGLASPKERAAHERRQLVNVVRGWDDVIDGDKKPVPFTEENFRAALQKKWFRDGLYRGYSESLNGEARLGN
jgi:hypothetical protein